MIIDQLDNANKKYLLSCSIRVSVLVLFQPRQPSSDDAPQNQFVRLLQVGIGIQYLETRDINLSS